MTKEKGIRILVVEDDTAIAGDMVVNILRSKGYDVVGLASSKNDAIEQALKTRPEIIIMDIRLVEDVEQDRGGIEAAYTIQKELDTTFIYLTAVEPNNELFELLAETKSFDFLVKPLDPKQLLATIGLATLKRQDDNSIFVCYSRENADIVEEMLKYIMPLKKLGIHPWVDTQIALGTNWKKSIIKALNKARAAIVFVSIDFIHSKFINEVELPKLLHEAEQNGILIIPIYIDAVPTGILTDLKLTKFQGLNSPQDTLDGWSRKKRAQDIWIKLYEFLASQLDAN